jgi:hypothetical protein
MRFPLVLGGSIGGLTFEEVFNNLPNIIEFVDKKWFKDKTTGVFLEFLIFVKNKLTNKETRGEHINRCRKYATNNRLLPSYMIKYQQDATRT